MEAGDLTLTAPQGEGQWTGQMNPRSDGDCPANGPWDIGSPPKGETYCATCLFGNNAQQSQEVQCSIEPRGAQWS